MALKRPTLSELREISRRLHMNLGDVELTAHLSAMHATFDALSSIAAHPDYVPEVRTARSTGREADRDGNELNAWVRLVSVTANEEGKLTGRKLVLKDNIALAGVPMLNGTSTLEGFIPDFDATVVSRILEAGGEIVGKARCEALCLSGGSHTGAGGPVRNPHDRLRSSGGSSSGCGALVGSGQIEMAIGGDQGGSIRIPSSWSGCVGMKPSWGLVPYTGVMPIEMTIDHVGPITNSVANNALLLEVIAGPDGLDPRQSGAPGLGYTAGLDAGVHGLKIGVLKEAFGRTESESDVDEAVRAAADRLAGAGARLIDVSVPWHNQGSALWTAIALEGMTRQMMLGDGLNWKGLHAVGLMKAHRNWEELAGELAPTVQNCMLIGKHLMDRFKGRLYAKAQNVARLMQAEIDTTLRTVDVLLMPTTPMKATPLPDGESDLAECLQRAFEMIGNTCPYNVTGHPAISVPCAKSQGLPVGLMLVGRHLDEKKLYRTAFCVEAQRGG